jgi:hypothetical protein
MLVGPAAEIARRAQQRRDSGGCGQFLARRETHGRHARTVEAASVATACRTGAVARP